MSNKKLKALIRSGQTPKAYSAKQISEGAMKELANSVSAALSLLSLSLDSEIRKFAIHLVSLDG